MNEEVGEGPLQASAVGEQALIDVGTSAEWPTERNHAVDKWETATIQASRQLMAILNEDDDDGWPSFMVVTPSQYQRICFVAWKAMAQAANALCLRICLELHDRWNHWHLSLRCPG